MPQDWDLESLRRQDEDSFERLVEAHKKLVFGLCQALGLRGPDIDDGAAEAFSAIYLALPSFRGDSALSTWVYQVAWRTLLRIRKTRKPSIPLDNMSIADPGPEINSSLEREETARKVWDAVSELEPRQAAAVELYYRRGLPVEEVASVLDCPANTVKTLLSRAREELRRKLRST